MSDNVVAFGKPKVSSFRKTVNLNPIILDIINWAEAQGIDVEHDVGFQVRLTDFTTYLQLSATGDKKTA